MAVHQAFTTREGLVLPGDGAALPAGATGELPLVLMPAIDMDLARKAAVRIDRLAGAPCNLLIIEDLARLGFIRCANLACAALRPELVVYLAQDALAGKDWLAHAMRALTAGDKAVCVLNDGIHGGLVAQFALVRLAFTEGHYGRGTLFFPGYRQHRADEELSHLARAADQLVFEPRALMMEVDYTPKRTINPEDSRLYWQRKAERQQAGTKQAEGGQAGT